MLVLISLSYEKHMDPIMTTSGATNTGSLLTAPLGGAYTTPIPVDARTLYSSEADTKAVKTEMNVFDAVIGIAILVIIGMIIALVATSKNEGKAKSKK